MHSADQDALRELVIRAYASGDGLPHILQGICIELAERIVAKPHEANRLLKDISLLVEAMEKLKAQ
jgi:hypothetical protein